MRSLRNLTILAAAAVTLVVALAGTLRAVSADSLMTAAQAQFSPIPTAPPALAGNPGTPAKIELGKMLYFDPRLSASHTISCNSCHNVGLGGVDTGETSIGHRWQRGGRNSPTVLNAVYNTAQFWDGRAKDLEEQAGGPMVNRDGVTAGARGRAARDDPGVRGRVHGCLSRGLTAHHASKRAEGDRRI